MKPQVITNDKNKSEVPVLTEEHAWAIMATPARSSIDPALIIAGRATVRPIDT